MRCGELGCGVGSYRHQATARAGGGNPTACARHKVRGKRGRWMGLPANDDQNAGPDTTQNWHLPGSMSSCSSEITLIEMSVFSWDKSPSSERTAPSSTNCGYRSGEAATAREVGRGGVGRAEVAMGGAGGARGVWEGRGGERGGEEEEAS